MGGVMDLEKTLDEINNLKAMAEKSAIFAKKIEPLLPHGWEARFVIGWPGLLFCSGFHDEAKNTKHDFIKICSLVEQAGIKLEREPWLEGESLFCLMGKGFLKTGDESVVPLRVEVRQFNVSECKLEYEEKFVKIAKLSEDCLNLASNKAG